MKCTRFEERIALYVEGDLTEVERHRVESHLEICAECRELTAELRDSQLVFKTVRHELPDGTALRNVRERVLAEVAALDPRTWWERIFFAGLPRKAAVAATALFALGGAALWFASNVHSPSNAPVVAQAVPTTLPQVTSSSVNTSSAPSPSNVAPSPRKVRRSASNRAATTVDTTAAGLPQAQGSEESPPAQIAVKLLTDDPNVIIYWLIEKGD